MSDKKWARVMSTVSMLMDLHQQQMEVVEDLVHFLMDEDGQNATETNESVLERLQRTVRKRGTTETTDEEKTP
jgi:hypothetical protein